ncbi:MAG: hypothetical protein ACFFB3_20340 [Candidatus Hodarchaeota archaeon]
MSQDIRKRFKEIKARATELDSSADKTKAAKVFFEFTKEVLGSQSNLPRYVRRYAAQAAYQALMRYLMGGQAKEMIEVVAFAEEQELPDLSYQLEEVIVRAKEFLEEKGWEDIEEIAEEAGPNQIEAIHKANELIKAAKTDDSKGNYLSAATNYMNASKILFSALEGTLLFERTKEPVKNAILRLLMADEWELAGEFIDKAQSHSIPVEEGLVRKIESRKELIHQYMSGERQIRVLASVDLRGIENPEETINRVMRDGFPFSFVEHKEITILSAWRLDYLRGVVPVELGDICPENTKNVSIKRLIGSIHDNYGADTLMLDFKTSHFGGAMVFSTSEALDLEIIHMHSYPT